MGSLALTVVNHGPAKSRLDGKCLGVPVAGLGQVVHRGTVAPSYATFTAYGGGLIQAFRRVIKCSAVHPEPPCQRDGRSKRCAILDPEAVRP
jgi:hypothetical protein